MAQAYRFLDPEFSTFHGSLTNGALLQTVARSFAWLKRTAIVVILRQVAGSVSRNKAFDSKRSNTCYTAILVVIAGMCSWKSHGCRERRSDAGSDELNQ